VRLSALHRNHGLIVHETGAVLNAGIDGYSVLAAEVGRYLTHLPLVW
jgi:hypothetical protein